MIHLEMRRHSERLVRLASYASVGVAVVLIGVKFFAWWMTHSVSLQASLIDSLLDAFASLINLFAIYQALKPADEEHRFGHGKAESLAGLGQSLFISGSALWLLYEVYGRYLSPEPVSDTGLGIITMGIAIALTFLLITFQKHVVRKTGSTAIAADMLHYRSDLLINGAVVISLLVAHFFATDLLDVVFGFLIGLYVLSTAWSIARSAFNILMDSEMSDAERQKIVDQVHTHPEIRQVHSLRTRMAGLEQFIELSVVMDEKLTLKEATRAVRDIRVLIRKDFPHSQIIVQFLTEEEVQRELAESDSAQLQ